MDTPDNTVINTQGLGKSYGKVMALKSLDLKVPRNSIFGFLGPNGAGKTTCIKLLLGLTRPTRGGGTVFGLDILRDSIEIRKRVGYLVQEPHYYDFMTAREILRFTARFFYSGPPAAIEARINETLDLTGLEDKADRPVKGFSGGERQRLGIAQAQVNHPDLLILDEPAASLDPQGRRDVLDVMQRLREFTTIFYSTHILSDVQQVSDTVAIVDHGELIAQAPLEELLAGKGAAVYTLVLEGDVSAARARVSGQPWVLGIEVAESKGRTTWQVKVSDEQSAREQLLKLVLSYDRINVTDFHRKRYDLEEVYLQIVEGAKHAPK
jgi:ABC-2 type transport system ATP-binding protein